VLAILGVRRGPEGTEIVTAGGVSALLSSVVVGVSVLGPAWVVFCTQVGAVENTGEVGGEVGVDGYLQTILKVLADTGEIDHDGDVELLEPRYQQLAVALGTKEQDR